MTARRRGAFWWLVALVLPIANPVVMELVAATTEVGGVVLVVAALAVDLAVIALAARWAWGRPLRAGRVLVGLVTTVALTVPYGVIEFYVFFAIACSHGGCD